MNKTDLPFILADWCRTVLGQFRILSIHSQAHSESEIWRLTTHQENFYLKAYRRSVKWGMEVHAYENWVSAFAGQSPRLIAVLEEPIEAILITELAGVAMDQATLSTLQEQVAWQAAGMALAKMHALPHGQWFGAPNRNGDSCSEALETDPVALMGSSLKHWFFHALSNGLLTPNEIKTVRHALTMLEVFADERPTACHGDYQPRNWIISMDATWHGVIDFEHARWDLRMNDLGYWWDRGLSERPDLRATFLEGYGQLSDRHQKQLHVIRILGALGRINWGHEYGDKLTEQLGHKTLKQLAETTSLI